MCRYLLSTLYSALAEERPDLLQIARTRLLPVLVASCEPMTVAELIWATGADAHQVSVLAKAY